jgi:ribonuclease HI
MEDIPITYEYDAYTDGGCRGGNPGNASWAWILTWQGKEVSKNAGFMEHGSNNEAEYMALIELLEACVLLGIKSLRVFCDSMLVICQIKGLWQIRKPELEPLCTKAQKLLGEIGDWDLVHIHGHAGILGNEVVDTRLCGALHIHHEPLRGCEACIRERIQSGINFV